MCGYDPSSDTIVMKKSSSSSTTSGIVMTYSFKNNTFSKSTSSALQGYFVDSKDTTNFSNNSDGDLLLGWDGSAGTTDGQPGGNPK